MAVTAPPGQSSPPRRLPTGQGRTDRLERERQAEAVRFRRSVTLVVLSLLAPGSAQLLAGDRRVGKIILFVWAGLLLSTGLVLLVVPLDGLARLAVRPWVLNLFTLLAFGVALGWAGIIVDAWRLADPPSLRRRHRLVLVAITALVAVLAATPLVNAARYATAARDAIAEIFPSRESAAAGGGRLNVLLLGVDAGKGRVGARPDSINVVSVDVQTARPLLISVPRNLQNARFAGGTPAAHEFPEGFTGPGDPSNWLLNATWTYGDDHPELFPGSGQPGLTAVKQAVQGTLDLPIHYSVVVDLQGFRDLVDALGGITIRVAEPIPVGQSGRVLEPGLRKLDGYETLWYARSRNTSSDYARMGRQRCVLGGIVREADPATVLAHFTELAKASTTLMTTDIPQERLPDLVQLALRAKDLPVTSLQLTPPLIRPENPDFAVIAEQVERAMKMAVEPAPSQPATAAATLAPSAGAPGSSSATGSRRSSEPAVDLASVCAYE